jgi:class 3 adenylate cyclase/tetratricopeptide (TPR) repeat protein
VLFADLVSFTTLSENRDPEEVRELLSRYFSQCRVVIGRYGGTVEKFIGDAVMAVWGVPVAHEDDAERAVRAGLELVALVTALGEEVGAPGLALRAGVVTGEVAVTVGATNEGMVAGDAVNTASRVQSTALPGQVWVDDLTRSLTVASIAYGDEGLHALKGKVAPVSLFSAQAVVAELGGGQRVDGLEAPHTGGDRDLRLLKELFHSTEEAGRPRLVIVDGEPGVGKSRLVWEFEKYIDGLSTVTRWHRGRCLSYGDGVAFWALTEAVRSRLGLTESDQGDVVTSRLEASLEQFVPDLGERDWLRPRLATLLGTGQPSAFAREDLFAAWTTFFERVGETGVAVVLVIDDAQHADQGLLDFVDHLLETARAGIFVLALARPELLARRPTLGGRRATVVRLEPLADDDMRRLIDGLVSGLPGDVRDQLVERADGIPLYAVETVRALIDRDAVIPQGGRYVPAPGVQLDLETIGAPASLQALVAARLDALTPHERRVVADASVLGAVFTRDGVAALAGPDVEVEPVLESLRRKEIVALQTDRLAADRGQLRFVQAVVRQVAYSTQSRRDRKARHLAAAAHLGGLTDSSADLSVVVAQHLLDALDSSATDDPDVHDIRLRACAELDRAAARARGLGATSEECRLLTSAIALTDDDVTRAGLLVRSATAEADAGRAEESAALARASAEIWDRLGRPVDAGVSRGREAVSLLNAGQAEQAVELARTQWETLVGTPESQAALLSLSRALANGYRFLGRHAEANAYLEHRIVLADQLGDYEALTYAYLSLEARYSFLGAVETSLALTEMAHTVARTHDLPAPQSLVLQHLVVLYRPRDLAAAITISDEAVSTARRAGQRQSLDFSLANRTFVLWTAGQLDQMREAALEMQETVAHAVEMAQTAALLLHWVTRQPLTLMEPQPQILAEDLTWAAAAGVVEALAAGDGAAGVAIADEAWDVVLDTYGLEDDFSQIWPLFLDVALLAGDIAFAERLLEPVLAAPRRSLSPLIVALLRHFEGRLGALRGDEPVVVETALRDGVRLLTEFGARLHAARASEHLGLWLASRGRSDEADDHLDLAAATYHELGAAGWLRTLEESRAVALIAPA